MKPALLPLTALLALFVTPAAFGQMPELNVERLCKARTADARMAKLTPAQGVADCVHDEADAKQKLSAVWAATPAPTRHRCESDAKVLGMRGYVDLLSCIQMADDFKSVPGKAAVKK